MTKKKVDEMWIELDGQERLFSKAELTYIVNEYYDRRCYKQEGMINPITIDRELFDEEREDAIEEWLREFINKALNKLEKDPQKYLKPFTVKILKKNGYIRTIKELKSLAKREGNGIINWIELAFKWAQIISNEKGSDEIWNKLCHEIDTIGLPQLFVWDIEKGIIRKVGGGLDNNPKIYIHEKDFCDNDIIAEASLSVVIYE